MHIDSENLKLLKRIESASSLYQKKNWIPQIAKNDKYMSNIQRKTSKVYFDETWSNTTEWLIGCEPKPPAHKTGFAMSKYSTYKVFSS